MLRYIAPLFVLLLGAGLLFLGFSADRPVLSRNDFVQLSGSLPADADLGGAFHTFTLDSLPGSTFSVKKLYLDAAAKEEFSLRMRAGAHVRVQVPAEEHARLHTDGRAHLNVHGLQADGVRLLDLDTCLAQQADQAQAEGRIYLLIGVVLVLAGLLLGYARWRAPISRYR